MKDTRGFKAYLALFIAFSIVGVLYFLTRYAMPPESKDAVLLILGVLLGTLKDVIGFYFGSSEGSQRKTELLQGAPDVLPTDTP